MRRAGPLHLGGHSGDKVPIAFLGLKAGAVDSATSNHPPGSKHARGTCCTPGPAGAGQGGRLPRGCEDPRPSLTSVFAANEVTRLQEENETLKEEVAQLRRLG